MTARGLSALIVVALLTASCDPSEDAAETTETTAATTTTTTLAPVGRQPLQPNGPPLIVQGDRGAYVEALQAYLVCAGVGQPEPDGPIVTVDGSFGPVTALAVAYFQAQLRRVPSGNPDEETFGLLARECREPRMITFPPGESSMEVAGHASPGDDDVLLFDGSVGQVLRLAALEGAVEMVVEGPEGEPLGGGASPAVEVELTADTMYTIRVVAAAPSAYLLRADARSPNVLVSDFGPMVLRHDGVGVAQLGNEAVNAAAVIALILHNPWTDSDWRDDVAACPGTHRAVLWLVQAGAGTDRHPAMLTAYFAEVGGNPVFVEYRYESLDLAALDPLAGALATRDGISIGSTLEDFADAYGAPSLDAQGRVTLPDGVVVTFDVVGDTGSPDPSSRVRVIRAGSGGCDSL